MIQPRTIEILDRLVGFDTTSSNSNLKLIDYVQSYLASHNVKSQLVYDEERKKANLYARVGPADKAGILLSGHTDTVPAASREWTTPPFRLTRKGDRYYGRGTSDMKGFIAVVLASIPDLTTRKLHTPLHLAFSHDEEVGCVGVRGLLRAMQSHRWKPAACIVGEPTSMQIVTTHKGKLAAQVVVRGKGCHSGMAPLGVNSVNFAARLIVWLEDFARTRQLEGPFEYSYAIPYSTIHTGTVQGGTTLNIVPDHCSFQFEIRNVPQDDPRQMLDHFSAYAARLRDEMQATSAGCDIAIQVTAEYPGLQTASDAEVVSFARGLTQSTGKQSSVSFGTEGGLFNDTLGIPTVICGPGSMDQGHKPDEFIEEAQLELCEQFLARLADELSA